MKKRTLEDIISESLLITSMTGIEDEKAIDWYRERQRVSQRLREIEEDGYSQYGEDEEW